MSASVPYLGVPGAMMPLQMPTGDLDAPATRGDQLTTLLSGGSVAVRRLNAKRTWTLPYDARVASETDVLTAFYEGVFGDGPFVYVDPTVRNVLTLDASTCGVRGAAWHGWKVTAGTLTRGGTVAPTRASASGVLNWSQDSGNGTATCKPGAVDGLSPDTGIVGRAATAPVWLPKEPTTASVWVQIAASTTATATLALVGYDTTGAYMAEVNAAGVALSGATWRRLTLTIRPNQPELAGAAYILPRLTWTTSSSTALKFAGAQLEYSRAVTDWQRGYGTPRVLSGPPGSTTTLRDDFNTYTNHQLLLAEV